MVTASQRPSGRATGDDPREVSMRLPRYACVDGTQDLAMEILSYHIFTNRGLANFHGMLVTFDARKCAIFDAH